MTPLHRSVTAIKVPFYDMQPTDATSLLEMVMSCAAWEQNKNKRRVTNGKKLAGD
jgi:hypothetical protein